MIPRFDTLPTPEELAKHITYERTALPIPALEEAVLDVAYSRAQRVLDYLKRRAERVVALDGSYCLCPSCEKHAALKIHWGEYYHTPWRSEPEKIYFCSNVCMDTFETSDTWPYYFCDLCERLICARDPREARLPYQFKDMPDGRYLCLKCFEKEVIRDGMPKEWFEQGLPLDITFRFSPRGQGYELLETTDKLIPARMTARSTIEAGLKVVVERASSKTVTIWTKEREQGRDPDIQVCNEGTIFVVEPLSSDGKEWLEEHVKAEEAWIGGNVIVGQHFVEDLVNGMTADGLVVK